MKHDMAKHVKEHSKRFLLVNAVSRRVRDLQNGYKSLVPPGGKTTEEIAIEEFRQNKIEVTTLDDEEDTDRNFVSQDMNG